MRPVTTHHTKLPRFRVGAGEYADPPWRKRGANGVEHGPRVSHVLDDMPKCDHIVRLGMLKHSDRFGAVDRLHANHAAQEGTAFGVHLDRLDVETLFFREVREHTVRCTDFEESTFSDISHDQVDLISFERRSCLEI